MNGGNIVITQTLLDIMKNSQQRARDFDRVSNHFCFELHQVLDTRQTNHLVMLIK